jgi:olefin beta-lactone synthetase
MNIVDILRDHSRTRGDAVALVDMTARGPREITFAGLDGATSRAATMLREAGLRPATSETMGDTVLVMQPMSIDLYIVLLAILRARLTAMFVDPTAGKGAIVRACRLIPPTALVGVPRAHLLRIVSPVLRRIPITYTTGPTGGFARRWGMWNGFAPCADEECSDQTAALITFTSGATGLPKVAVRSHELLLAQHRALSPALALQPGDTVVTTFPMFVLSHLGAGACSVLVDTRRKEPRAWEATGQFSSVTALDAAPAYCEDLVERGRREGLKFPSLRRVIVGGGPVFPSLLEALRESAPRATVTTLYGSTEAEPIAHVDRDQLAPEDTGAMRAGRGLLAGTPVSEICLRVLRDGAANRGVDMTQAEFDAECAPEGVAGEIAVSGAHVLRGYYQGAGDRETKLRVDSDVWHRTGDAGFLDERGRLWLLGRCSARVRDGRGDLYPFQVECAVADEPGVRRSALVALGGKRVLLIELKRGADPATPEIVHAKLAWAQIDRVSVCDKIPVDHRHHSKVDYGALATLLARGE